jgi:K+-transporting ATPase ATPase C chain
MLREMWTALRVLLVLTLMTGVVYPLVVTAVAQAVFPEQANGSLVLRGDAIVGSRLLGQPFDDPGWFWGRPSATSPACNASASGGSNLGPTNPALATAVAARVARLRALPGGERPIPVDLVTSSGSGLDPHVSPAAARFQVPRVAAARGLDAARVAALVEQHIEPRQLGCLGEARVNVLELNLALERLAGR